MRLFVLGLMLAIHACSLSGMAAEPVAIGSRRELFVDRTLVDRLEGKAELRLHHPAPAEVAIVHDAPWEGNASAYHSIFQDGDRSRMYYRGWRLTYGEKQLTTSEECVCYAESADGIHWKKPELGLQEFAGSTSNNIVITSSWAKKHGVTAHAPAVFRDDNPAVPAASRYKMFLVSNDPLGMRLFQSEDGFHWSPVGESPVITDGAFDSQNLAFWDGARGEYRAYWRFFTKGITTGKVWKPDGDRAIRTAVSKDLLSWSNPADLTYGEAPPRQLYESGVAPYSRAPHLLIGFPVRYVDRGVVRHSTSPDDGSDRLTKERIATWSRSLRELPEFAHRAMRAQLSERYGSAITETLLMASRDGKDFTRWDEAFLRPGIERPGVWNYGQHLVAWRPVETKSALAGAPNELSIFTTEGYSTSAGVSLRRYALRADGFVSLHAPMSGGALVTHPIEFEGKSLSLNLSTSAAGTVRVALLTAEGEPISGFTSKDCDELFGDALDRIVSWKANSDVSSLARRPVRLRIEAEDADVYSFQFR